MSERAAPRSCGRSGSGSSAGREEASSLARHLVRILTCRSLGGGREGREGSVERKREARGGKVWSATAVRFFLCESSRWVDSSFRSLLRELHGKTWLGRAASREGRSAGKLARLSKRCSLASWVESAEWLGCGGGSGGGAAVTDTSMARTASLVAGEREDWSALEGEEEGVLLA
jgi:hypothetical protein